MHRTLAIAALAAAALTAGPLTVAAQDQAPAADPAPRAHGEMRRAPLTRTAAEERAAAMFARLDADGDARLTPDDREKHAQDRADSRFERLDADGDGAITRAEFAAAGEGRREQMAGRRAERQQADGEAREGRRGRMQAMRAMRGGRGGERAMLAGADADGDGAITQAELTTVMLARFDAADADHDGTLSAEERRAERGQRGEGRRFGRHRRGAAADSPAPAAR